MRILFVLLPLPLAGFLAAASLGEGDSRAW